MRNTKPLRRKRSAPRSTPQKLNLCPSLTGLSACSTPSRLPCRRRASRSWRYRANCAPVAVVIQSAISASYPAFSDEWAGREGGATARPGIAPYGSAFLSSQRLENLRLSEEVWSRSDRWAGDNRGPRRVTYALRTVRAILGTATLAALALFSRQEPAHAVDAQAHCAKVGNDDTVRMIPPSLVAGAARLFHEPASEAASHRDMYVYRCMGGSVWVCDHGANILCIKAESETRFTERHRLLQRKSQRRFRAHGRNWSRHYPLVGMRGWQGAHQTIGRS